MTELQLRPEVEAQLLASIEELKQGKCTTHKTIESFIESLELPKEQEKEMLTMYEKMKKEKHFGQY